MRYIEHLLVAIGIAEGEDRLPPYEAIDADGLARSVVDEFYFRLFNQFCFAICRDLEFHHPRRSDNLLRRYAVDLVSEARMNSIPPPETINVLKPLARR